MKRGSDFNVAVNMSVGKNIHDVSGSVDIDKSLDEIQIKKKKQSLPPISNTIRSGICKEGELGLPLIGKLNLAEYSLGYERGLIDFTKDKKIKKEIKNMQDAAHARLYGIK
jgi:hypothetical protein